MRSYPFARIAPRPTWASDSTDSSTSSRGTRQYDIDNIEEDSPWYKKNVLSLDGGGVRVYSCLLILQALMTEIARIESDAGFADATPVSPCPYMNNVNTGESQRTSCQLLPCHYFDYIGGTGTGGLIAVMLGRLRMTVDDAIASFNRINARLLAQASHRYLVGNPTLSKARVLDDAVRQMQPSHSSPSETSSDFQSDIIRCRTLVFAMRGSQDHPGAMSGHMFYSHRTTGRSKNADDVPDEISEVVRASMTTTSHFKTEKVRDHYFLDASTSLNNPSLAMWTEVHDQHRRRDNPIDVFLSLGCSSGDWRGQSLSSQPQIMGIQRSARKSDERMAYISATADKGMRVLLQTWRSTRYFRLETQNGLENIRSHNWKPKSTGKATFSIIEKATREYLDIPAVRIDIQNCARSLVDRRRRRAQTSRWQSFAFGVIFRCRYDDGECTHVPSDKIFFGPEELLDHFQTYHDEAPPHEGNLEKMKQLLQSCREPQKEELHAGRQRPQDLSPYFQ